MKNNLLLVITLFLIASVPACSLWQQQMVTYHDKAIMLEGSKAPKISLPHSSYQFEFQNQKSQPEVSSILANQIKIKGLQLDSSSPLILLGELAIDVIDEDTTYCEGEIWEQYGVKRYHYKAAIGTVNLKQSYQFHFQLSAQSWPIANVTNQRGTAYWPKDAQAKTSVCAQHYNGSQSMPLKWGYYEKATFKHEQLLQQYVEFLGEQPNVIVYSIDKSWLSSDVSANKLESELVANYQQWLTEQRQQLFLNSNASIIASLNKVLDQNFGYGVYKQSFASYGYNGQKQLNQSVALLRQGQLQQSLEMLMPLCVQGQSLHHAMACYHLAMAQFQLSQAAAAKASIERAVAFVDANQSEIVDLFSGSFNQQVRALSSFIQRYQPISVNVDTTYQSVD